MRKISPKITKWFDKTDRVLQYCLGLPPHPTTPPVKDTSRPYLAGQTKLASACLPRDTVGIIDISGSMGAADCKPTRLEAAKMANERYILERASLSSHDRVAIVKFSDKGKVVLPLTDIMESGKIIQCMQHLDTGGGTDLAEGLKLAPRLLFPYNEGELSNHPRNKHILIVTDGHCGHPITEAKKLKAQGVLIEVIGIGGNPSAVNEELLRKVATTDPDGFTHYWFIEDTTTLVTHYQQLARGIVFRGGS